MKEWLIEEINKELLFYNGIWCDLKMLVIYWCKKVSIC